MNYKRLAILLIIALAISTAAFAVEGVKFGGSLETRGWWIASNDAPDSKFTDSEVLLWMNADLADNVMARVNLKYKDSFGSNNNPIGIDANTYEGNIDLFEGYILLKRPFNFPGYFRAGRWMIQNKIEEPKQYETKFGEGFMVPNNAPFDGMSLTAVLPPIETKIDFFYIKMRENDPLLEDDVAVYGMYGMYNGIENHQIDFYAAFIDAQVINLPSGVILPFYNHMYIGGLRAKGSFLEKQLAYKAEFTVNNQDNELTGEKTGIAGLAGVEYTFASEIKPSVRANFYYLDEDFVQPIGHVDQDDVSEKGYGRIADYNTRLVSNIMFGNVGFSVRPTDKLTIDVDGYYYKQVDPNETLGMEVDATLLYQYSDNTLLELVAGYYTPDNEKLSAARGIGADDVWMVKGGVKVAF